MLKRVFGAEKPRRFGPILTAFPDWQDIKLRWHFYRPAGTKPTNFNPMKKLISSILAAASLASASLVFMSGCAGTPTRESTGEYVDDSAITTKVKAELVRDPIVKALQVDVTTFKGVVQLSGFVDTAEQKAQAEADAKTVNGVKEVKNNIVVKTAQ